MGIVKGYQHWKWVALMGEMGARQVNRSNGSCDRDAKDFRGNRYFRRTDVCNSVVENVKASKDWCRS